MRTPLVTLALVAFIYSSFALGDEPEPRGPFSDLRCQSHTVSSFKDYRKEQLADSFQIVNELEVEDILDLFDSKEEFIDHLLIQAPWILANKSVVFGSYAQCFTLLHLFLDEEDLEPRGPRFEKWASCVEWAFPDISPAVKSEMNCMEALASK